MNQLQEFLSQIDENIPDTALPPVPGEVSRRFPEMSLYQWHALTIEQQNALTFDANAIKALESSPLDETVIQEGVANLRQLGLKIIANPAVTGVGFPVFRQVGDREF